MGMLQTCSNVCLSIKALVYTCCGILACYTGPPHYGGRESHFTATCCHMHRPPHVTHRTLPTARCPPHVAHRTLPTARCPTAHHASHKSTSHKSTSPSVATLSGIDAHRALHAHDIINFKHDCTLTPHNTSCQKQRASKCVAEGMEQWPCTTNS